MGGGNPLKKIEREGKRVGRQLDSDEVKRALLLGPETEATLQSLDFASGGKGEDPDAGASDELGRLSKELFMQTDPLRRGLIGRSEQFIEGGLDVTQSPQYGALKQGAEEQFGRARQNILGSTPVGGALSEALAQTELSKAGALTAGIGEIGGREQDRALSLATGTPLAASFGGLGQAAMAQSQAAQAEAAQNAAAKGALGSGAGAMMGSKGPAAGAATTAAAAGA